ncbi:MAG: LicD family protein [Eubacterium sp.]|nr:LicD family protein [Eubacterium sp.]
MFTENEKKNLYAIQNIELKLLDEIDRICKKHGLTYFVAGGTLLGAIRHNDFIPWDDDIDIDLKREDFKKLIEVLPDELSDEFEFVNYNSFGDKFCDFIPRVFYNDCSVINSFRSPDGSTNLANDKRINGVFVELYCLHETDERSVKRQIFTTKLLYGLAMDIESSVLTEASIPLPKDLRLRF